MPDLITCFLVDDDRDDQEIFGIALEKLAYPVACVTAEDGYFALQKFQEEPHFVPDLIFLDLNMPRVNGLQCLLEIRKNSALQHVPVIIYTTSSSDTDKSAAELLGAQDFVTKHTDIDELSITLKNIFEKHLTRRDRSGQQ